MVGVGHAIQSKRFFFNRYSVFALSHGRLMPNQRMALAASRAPWRSWMPARSTGKWSTGAWGSCACTRRSCLWRHRPSLSKNRDSGEAPCAIISWDREALTKCWAYSLCTLHLPLQVLRVAALGRIWQQLNGMFASHVMSCAHFGAICPTECKMIFLDLGLIYET